MKKSVQILLIFTLFFTTLLILPFKGKVDGSFTFGQITTGKVTPYPTNLPLTPTISKIKNIITKLDDYSKESNKSFTSNNKTFKIYPTPTRTFSEIFAEIATRVNNASPTPVVLPSQVNIGLINDNPLKSTYTLIVLGDSMVDALGKNLTNLKVLLSQTYPKYSFALLNYGFGSTDLENGLYRLTHGTIYLNKYYPPLLSFQPDILVIESFAYNHWSSDKSDLDRQWLTIAKIIDTIKLKSPTTKIVLASTVAPNPLKYGDGILNWSSDDKWLSAQTTKAYLQNMINFATSQNYPLVDAFTPTLDQKGYGLAKFISTSDNLHPSEDGKLLFSQKIVEVIKSKNLLK